MPIEQDVLSVVILLMIGIAILAKREGVKITDKLKEIWESIKPEREEK